MCQHNLVGQGLVIIETSRSHLVGLLWTSDKPNAETSDNSHPSLEADIHDQAGFEPTITASERSQTNALDIATAAIVSFS
jgi:hypothetical protein